ncbi:amino acid ABC transporter permease [Bacillus sp. AGMB 02131]|uniref:Amino acid ABC transporter permease n=1 Tax=Peribacillus faecalis TaxID=2772559 RepID=A0A927CZH5_9BACI|nr:amino acid ABC transporter permease [Peribacillus faecalis]MBD3108790.1 amino acid ABC transporter permease [Peribacillus faecalis]
MNFNFDLIIDYAPLLWKGTLLTIGLSIVSILFGTIIGLFIALGKMMRNKWVAFPFVAYIAFFRGTPLFVQLLLIHFGVIPLFTGETNAIAAAIATLSLNSAAYIAEIFRGGIQSIEKGQMEGARSLGMSHIQAMRYVILPQALKRSIPPLGNEFIVLVKESSLAAIITAPEIMYYARNMSSAHFAVWEPYLTAALIYLVITLTLSFILHRVEKRLDKS